MALRPHSVGFTFLIGALAALPPLSIDLGLPALTLLEDSLGASATDAALTLSLFLAGFGVSQLLMGPLSDRHGRRPVMLAGMTLYALAGLGCTLAPSMEVLLAFRLLEGIGAAGGTTLAMAVVRDSFDGQAARIKMSQVSMVITIAPIIAPSLGGLLLVFGEWRLIYAVLTITGVLLVLAVRFGLAESHPPVPGARLDLIGRYATVLRQRRTMGYVLVNTLGSGGLFAFISSSPLVLMDAMGVSMQVFGLLFATTSSGILLGSTINSMLARRGVSPRMPLALGLVAGPLAALAAAGFLAAGVERLETFIPFIVVVGICRGMTTPNITHAALEPVPHHAGLTAALMGCGQMLCMALSGVVVAALYPHLGPLGVALAMVVFLGSGLAAWLIVERGENRLHVA
ncbi:MAG: multidrug effflux MFS transporter [Acetobacteraceae bacterium]|nr:multidrug effflux MFS transporter [Acetobacteraceae bacterium]